MDIELYGVEVGESRELVGELTPWIDEARSLAIAKSGKLVAFKFSLDDSELVADYSGDNES